eukprot:284819210_6
MHSPPAPTHQFAASKSYPDAFSVATSCYSAMLTSLCTLRKSEASLLRPQFLRNCRQHRPRRKSSWHLSTSCDARESAHLAAGKQREDKMYFNLRGTSDMLDDSSDMYCFSRSTRYSQVTITTSASENSLRKSRQNTYQTETRTHSKHLDNTCNTSLQKYTYRRTSVSRTKLSLLFRKRLRRMLHLMELVVSMIRLVRGSNTLQDLCDECICPRIWNSFAKPDRGRARNNRQICETNRTYFRLKGGAGTIGGSIGGAAASSPGGLRRTPK